ncbi:MULTISPECIES: PAAR domain-containing protein [Streptomyces]|uniref:PAAR domain-containing protein n=2 Tax=Streptomyces TaxID=1883 RepID=A0ABU4K2K1_9ACTN|nr:PAAR domain-containing protein [Streptomyces roseolus]MDX2291655.1 PAAR domain-containing protein [Streptomyces roseolus]
MPTAARVTDPTSHPGTVGGPGVATVLVAGLPAAVAGDAHVCAFPPPAAHPPTPFAKGSVTVLIGGRGALRQGDAAGCGALVAAGCPTVQIGG